MAGRPGRSGGHRKGRPNQQYPNRSDLRQPARAAPNQTYGDAGQQLQAQRAIPLLGTPLAAPGGNPSASPAVAPGMSGGGQQAIPSLSDPTARPNEPLTAGLPTGPGGGPEMLQQPDPLVKAAAALNQLGKNVDPDTARIRAMVNAHLGNQGAS